MMETLVKFLSEVLVSYSADQLAKIIDVILSGKGVANFDIEFAEIPNELKEILVSLSDDEINALAALVRSS
jgi:hypothetical protein